MLITKYSALKIVNKTNNGFVNKADKTLPPSISKLKSNKVDVLDIKKLKSNKAYKKNQCN